ncbi:hypothetical protein [Streptomyces zhihengii]
MFCERPAIRGASSRGRADSHCHGQGTELRLARAAEGFGTAFGEAGSVTVGTSNAVSMDVRRAESSEAGPRGAVHGGRGDVAPAGSRRMVHAAVVRSAGEQLPIQEVHMPLQTTTLTVLIASPGDTALERDAVEDVIRSWNSDHTLEQKVHLLALRWELDAFPVIGRGTAQEMVNSQFADKADIVVGLFYSRLGHPTASAPSGTAEEISRAVDRGAAVHVFFSGANIPQDHDAQQFAALREFREQLRGSGLLGAYSSPDDLKAKVRTCLEHDVHLLTDAGEKTSAQSPANAAVMRCRYLSEDQQYTDSLGRLKTRQVRQRLRVENLGTGAAEHIEVVVEPLGEGASPVVGDDLTAERLPSHTYFDIPVAPTFGSSPQARVVITWEESGEQFSERQTVRWT